MQERHIALQIFTSQQATLELEFQTLFGLQVDDVFDAPNANEKILTFVIKPEQAEVCERLLDYLEQKKAAGTIRVAEMVPLASQLTRHSGRNPMRPHVSSPGSKPSRT